MTTFPISPAEALYEKSHSRIIVPVCDHYAGNEKFMRKALALQNKLGPVFDITFDCEDGAMIGEEKYQAALIASYLSSDENRFQRIGVRIHDFSHPHWKNDLQIILRSVKPPAYITVPKVQSAAEIRQITAYIQHIQATYHPTRSIPLDCLIENYSALDHVFEIASIAQVQTLSFGLMDFISEHRGAISDQAMTSPLQFDHALIRAAKTQIAMACHRYGKVSSHNVTTEIKNSESAYHDAKRARDEFGFLRMWSIHPTQIPQILQAFMPDEATIHQAQEILFNAQKLNWAPIRYQNKLHDRASYRYYWYILQQAFSLQYDLPEPFQSWFLTKSEVDFI